MGFKETVYDLQQGKKASTKNRMSYWSEVDIEKVYYVSAAPVTVTDQVYFIPLE